jgi:hypothetical protein
MTFDGELLFSFLVVLQPGPSFTSQEGLRLIYEGKSANI